MSPTRLTYSQFFFGAFCLALLLIPGLLLASDKYGGGTSQTSRSGSGNYSITTNSSSRYSTVTVRNNNTGQVSTFSDWNRDGDNNDPNERMTSNYRDSSSGNGNRFTPGRTNPGSGPTTGCVAGRIGCGTTGNPSGTPQCVAGGTCQTTVSNNQCGVAVSVSGTNRCVSGVRSCQSPATVSTGVLQAPCTNFNDFDPTNTLRSNPAVVREGDPVEVTWDLGTSRNYHGNCVLRGPGIATNYVLTARFGTVTISEVTGPHQYTLACGSATINLQLRVIPAIYES